MATYLDRLIGQIFLMDSDKGPRKSRVYSTRLVDEENPKRAETLARNLIRNDPRLQNSLLNDESDPPVITLTALKKYLLWHRMPRIVLTRSTGKTKTLKNEECTTLIANSC
jgi:hypothetical protein